jgi:8-oxo-dGTP diphosphatase
MMIYVNARAIIERTKDNKTEIVVQIRNKPGDFGRLELPGGQVHEFESLTDAVKREVLEETGLEVTFVDGEKEKVISSGTEGGFSIECIQPFAVYQTLSGPVDSMGVYFRCQAQGNLKDIGDCSLNAKWIGLEELQSLVERNQNLFSEIDLAGILMYLKDQR